MGSIVSYTSAGTLDKTHHYYYSDQWQVLEERVDSSSTADKQFVWGLRYVDDLVLRDENSTRYYSLQDANWNVVAVASNTGRILEHYAYTPYYYSAESKMYQPQITRISLMKLLSRAIAVVDLAVRSEVDSFSSTKSVVIGEVRGYNPAL